MRKTARLFMITAVVLFLASSTLPAQAQEKPKRSSEMTFGTWALIFAATPMPKESYAPMLKRDGFSSTTDGFRLAFGRCNRQGGHYDWPGRKYVHSELPPFGTIHFG